MHDQCMHVLLASFGRHQLSYHVHGFHIGEFGIVYKAHIVKHKNGQVVTETMAVKTLKGEPDILKALIYRASCHAPHTLYLHELNLNM